MQAAERDKDKQRENNVQIQAAGEDKDKKNARLMSKYKLQNEIRTNNMTNTE
jgi:hypothetical protein